MDIVASVYDNGIVKYKTHCCALSQLGVSNYDSLYEIESIINEMKESYEKPMTSSEQCNYGTHERAVFVITLPKETELVENLIKLGFKEIAEFHRRICYPQDEMLKMWILTW